MLTVEQIEQFHAFTQKGDFRRDLIIGLNHICNPAYECDAGSHFETSLDISEVIMNVLQLMEELQDSGTLDLAHEFRRSQNDFMNDDDFFDKAQILEDSSSINRLMEEIPIAIARFNLAVLEIVKQERINGEEYLPRDIDTALEILGYDPTPDIFGSDYEFTKLFNMAYSDGYEKLQNYCDGIAQEEVKCTAVEASQLLTVYQALQSTNVPVIYEDGGLHHDN